MKKFKTLAEAGKALITAAESEQKVYLKQIQTKAEGSARQQQIKNGEITPSGKSIIRFGEIQNTSRN